MAVDLSNSPTESSNRTNSRILDSAPSMPREQRRQSPFFTNPEDQSGMGAMGGDPMIQTMQASKAVDMAFQQIAATHPEVVQALAQIQQQFHGIVASLIQGAAAQQQGQPPMIMPPEMQGQMGPSAGQQMGPGL